jgi:thiol-disulfide isomerase/thioredoxin
MSSRHLFGSFVLLAMLVAPFVRADQPLPAGLVTTASGLQYAITVHGTGALAQPGQVVIAHYTGSFMDGTVFDSSRTDNQPFAFTLGRKQVIAGWDEAFARLHVGDQATLIVPPGLAYGDKPRGNIPANSTLRFEVELLALKNGALADLLQDAIDTAGLAAAQTRFADYQAGKLGELFLSESQMNGLGYRYLTKNKLPEALAVLGWNVALFPKSGNVYDSYGEVLLKNGQLADARQNYEKSLALDPSNKNAEKMLAEIKAAEESPAAKLQMQERAELETAMNVAFEAADHQRFDVPALKAKLSAFLEKYPQDAEAAAMVSNYFYYVETADLATAKSEWAAFASHPNEKVKELAAQKLRLAELIREPLDLKFTAADGREVDLASLRGKVVLIDFWATWCPPCLEEIPNVVAAYQRYHDRGFEIVGISFEQAPDPAKPAKRQKTAEQMLAFTREHGMPWPQFYDGTYWQNPFGKKYGIRGIPAMFLLNKAGMVVSTNARGAALEAMVRKLLQE